MSLYVFGKIETALALNDLETRLRSADGKPVFFTQGFDPDDELTLNELCPELSKATMFRISSEASKTDAVALWNEAYHQLRGREDPGDIERDVLKTRIGSVVWTLLSTEAVKTGCIAFVDGGIEVIMHGSPDDCWCNFLQRIVQPWDCLDNPLFVWKRD